MTIAPAMAEPEESAKPETGAPIAKDAIDPELVRLARREWKFGIITCAGLVFLAFLFVWRLTPDRRFGSASSTPEQVAVSAVVGGDIAVDRYVEVAAEPIVAGAIRSTTAKGTLGLRVVPARGTKERLWLVMSGDGGEPPANGSYVGRLRKLDDLALASSVSDYAATHPRPQFATVAAVRAAFASGRLATTTGEDIAVADRDRVVFDVVEPELGRVACTFIATKLPDAAAWQKALAAAGIVTDGPPTPDGDTGVSFAVRGPDIVAATTKKIGDAKLGAARVDPVYRHNDTTWGALRGAQLDPKVDLVGVYVARAIPDGAYALVVGERPDDYWYVMWVTIAVAAIGLLFAWGLVRAVRRDLLPARA